MLLLIFFIDGKELHSVLKDYDLIKYFENLPLNIISSLARFYVHDFVHLIGTKGQPEEQEYYEVKEQTHAIYSFKFLSRF